MAWIMEQEVNQRGPGVGGEGSSGGPKGLPKNILEAAKVGRKCERRDQPSLSV